jgi:hypothetical protein
LPRHRALRTRQWNGAQRRDMTNHSDRSPAPLCGRMGSKSSWAHLKQAPFVRLPRGSWTSRPRPPWPGLPVRTSMAGTFLSFGEFTVPVPVATPGLEPEVPTAMTAGQLPARREHAPRVPGALLGGWQAANPQPGTQRAGPACGGCRGWTTRLCRPVSTGGSVTALSVRQAPSPLEVPLRQSGLPCFRSGSLMPSVKRVS